MMTLANIRWRLKQPRTTLGWVLCVFSLFWRLLGDFQNVMFLAEKWPKGWAVPNPSWAWLPLLFGASWLVVTVLLPDKQCPMLRRFAPEIREHPSATGMLFTVIPIRNESTTAEVSQLAAFLEFTQGWRGHHRVEIHDAAWHEWFPDHGSRNLGRNETRHVVIAVTWGKDNNPDRFPPLAVGFEHELKQPKPTSLREAISRTRWVKDGHELVMKDLAPAGKWKVRVKITGYKYCFEFKENIITDSCSVVL